MGWVLFIALSCLAVGVALATYYQKSRIARECSEFGTVVENDYVVQCRILVPKNTVSVKYSDRSHTLTDQYFYIYPR